MEGAAAVAFCLNRRALGRFAGCTFTSIGVNHAVKTADVDVHENEEQERNDVLTGQTLVY